MGFAKPLLKNRVVQIIFFLAATWALFNCIFFLGTNPAKWIGVVFNWLARWIWTTVPSVTLRDFLVYGLITGAAGFLVYLPNIILLFFLSHLLYETGISPAAARILNPLFHFFGLNGESFQPLLFGFGCSVTAIHGANYIRDPKNRLVTMLIAPFMSCGSKFGVYVLLISCIFANNYAGTVMFSLYCLGIVFAIISSSVFRGILKIKKNTSSFDPPEPSSLKKPDWAMVLKRTLVDGWVFCSRAGSVIVIAAITIWALSYWPGISQAKYDAMAENARANNQQIPSKYALSYHRSYAASMGHFIEPAFRPMGQNWKNSIALVTSIAGRTTIISTLMTLYGIDYSPDSRRTLVRALSADPTFSKLSALAMMLFVLLCGSCLASITMFFRATKSVALTGLFIVYPIVVAWVVSAGFYTVGRLVIK